MEAAESFVSVVADGPLLLATPAAAGAWSLVVHQRAIKLVLSAGRGHC